MVLNPEWIANVSWGRKMQGRALLSPINSGSTIYRPVRQSHATFKSLNDYPYQERRKLRGQAHAIAEVAIDYSVPDIRTFVEYVERRQGNRALEVLYSK